MNFVTVDKLSVKETKIWSFLWFRGVWGHAPQQIFKIRIFKLAKNEFQTTKLPDFSVTFKILLHIP